jgi:hypothetical protein
MHSQFDSNEDSGFGVHASAWEAPELTGPLGNLVRLLFSEAWRTKSHPNSRAATFDLTNLSRDFMRRNVAANQNIPQIALTQ